MKKLLLVLIAFGTFSMALGTSSQVEFVARIKAIQPVPGGFDLTLNLTPSHTITARATTATEVRDQSNLSLALTSLAPDDRIRVEGIFVEGGILALEINVTDRSQEFEIRGAIQALTPEGGGVRIEVLGFSVLATPSTEVEDALGNRLFLNELEVGQQVKVEGNTAGTINVELRLNQPASDDLVLGLFVKDGDPSEGLGEALCVAARRARPVCSLACGEGYQLGAGKFQSHDLTQKEVVWLVAALL